MSRRLTLAALSALVLVTAACGSADADDTAASVPEATTPPTIGGVGVLPAAVSTDRSPNVMVRPPMNDDGSAAELFGEIADGNRVLLIGDSILTSTAQRYGGTMCAELVPLGWQVQLEAEPSRFIGWGNKVLDRVLPDELGAADDFDTAVVFLGSNYDGDEAEYERELRTMLDRLAPRPTLLLTVTEYRPEWAEVNVVIRSLALEYDNVRLVDWESVAQTPGVLSGDRLHPSDAGRQVLAELIAGSLGQVAIGEGECLLPEFTDDSARTPTARLDNSSSSSDDIDNDSNNDSGSSTSGGSTDSGGSSSGGSSSGGGTSSGSGGSSSGGGGGGGSNSGGGSSGGGGSSSGGGRSSSNTPTTAATTTSPPVTTTSNPPVATTPQPEPAAPPAAP